MWKFIMIFVIYGFLTVSVHALEKEEAQNEKIIIEKEEIQHYQLPNVGAPSIDEARINTMMDLLQKQLYKPPIDATLNRNYGIVEGESGITLDRREFLQRFYNIFYHAEESQMEVPEKMIHPRVDGALLKEISQKRLGSYSTYYRNSNKSRAHNIVLSAEAINGTVIFPGETFSFNKIVGERTPERGYKRAPVIVRGEFDEDVGGGICQVSSTLFNAVDLRGIQIIERYTHSRKVPYVPPGRDATVSWWGPDFVFKNLYNEPVLVKARAANGVLSVEIYSSQTAEYFSAE